MIVRNGPAILKTAREDGSVSAQLQPRSTISHPCPLDPAVVADGAVCTAVKLWGDAPYELDDLLAMPV